MKRIDRPQTDPIKAICQFELTGAELLVIRAAMNILSPSEVNRWAENKKYSLPKQNWDDGSAISTVIADIDKELETWGKK